MRGTGAPGARVEKVTGTGGARLLKFIQTICANSARGNLSILLIMDCLCCFCLLENRVNMYGCEATRILRIVRLEPDKRRKWGRWPKNDGLRGDKWMRNVGFERGHYTEKQPIFDMFPIHFALILACGCAH
jgi:hypothetical protein